MENLMVNMFDEHLEEIEVEERDRWIIKSDEEAEWWIEVNDEKLIEIRRYKMSIENKIAILQEKLTEWLENNKMDKFIETKKTPKWGELKKITKVVSGQVVTEDGEVIEGVEVVERAPVFKVEV